MTSVPGPELVGAPARLSSARETRRALARAERGQSLDASEGAALMSARGEDLERLLALASRLRDRGLHDIGRPAVVTYSRKVFIPLTQLCRDRCHYCTFVKAPADVESPYLTPSAVVDVARAGAAAGCKEALFTLGDRPEERWPQAQQWLESAGYASTLDYLRSMAIMVLEETGLLPHLNPGVMSWEEMVRLRPVAPSMGLMLETTSRRLWEEPGAPHYGSPDKEPRVRLRVLEDAGRLNIPFTTGLLVGIGETLQDRAETVRRDPISHRAFGHVQEVIVQNFRAKQRYGDVERTRCHAGRLPRHRRRDASALGCSYRVQAPPNLSAPEHLPRLLSAGIDDWGGVSPVTEDHVNPERPWPHVKDWLVLTGQAGLRIAGTSHCVTPPT